MPHRRPLLRRHRRNAVRADLELERLHAATEYPGIPLVRRVRLPPLFDHLHRQRRLRVLDRVENDRLVGWAGIVVFAFQHLDAGVTLVGLTLRLAEARDELAIRLQRGWVALQRFLPGDRRSQLGSVVRRAQLEDTVLHLLRSLSIQLSESSEFLGMFRRHGDNGRHHAQLSDRGVHCGRYRWTDVLGSFEQIRLVGQLAQDQRGFSNL